MTRAARRSLLWSVAAAAVALWWWQADSRGSTLPATEDPVRLSLGNSTLYQYDAAGVQNTVIRSPYGEHLKNGEDRLQQPDIRTRLENGSRRLRGDLATRNAEKNLITLSGNVVGEQDSGAHRYRLETAGLHYYPEQQLVETDDPVVLSSDTGRTEADGARWQMAENLFILKKNIRSTYAPAH